MTRNLTVELEALRLHGMASGGLNWSAGIERRVGYRALVTLTSARCRGDRSGEAFDQLPNARGEVPYASGYGGLRLRVLAGRS
jgi:hypothetical protein